MAGPVKQSNSYVFLALISVIVWSVNGYFGTVLRHIPAFFITGVALLVSGLLGMIFIKHWRLPWKTITVGVYGYLGYHILFYSSLQMAPPIEANMLNYFWPLFIVLFTPVFLRDVKLKPFHIIGALMGFIGAILIVTGGKISLRWEYLPGYLAALAAAFIWASYSVMTKRLEPFHSGAIGVFSMITGVISLGVFFLQQGSISLPAGIQSGDWITLILTGLGPLGFAFMLWDASLKRGDTRVIGAITYLTPLLSTIILVCFADQTFHWTSVVALVLILSGAVVGSLDLFRSKKKVVIEGETEYEQGN